MNYHALVSEVDAKYKGSSRNKILGEIDNRVIKLGRKLSQLKELNETKVEHDDFLAFLIEYFDESIIRKIQAISKGQYKSKKNEEGKATKEDGEISISTLGRILKEETEDPDQATLDLVSLLVDYAGWKGFQEKLRIDDFLEKDTINNWIGKKRLNKKEKNYIDINSSLELNLSKSRQEKIKESFPKIIYRLKQKGIEISNFMWEDFVDSINKNIDESELWSKEFSFDRLKDSLNINDIYIHLDFYLKALTETYDTIDPDKESINFNEYFKNFNKNLILTGQPGSGKTTTLKYIVYELIFSDMFKDRFDLCLFFRFRDFNRNDDVNNINTSKGESIFEKILTIFGIYDSSFCENQKIIQETIYLFMNQLNILLVIDGFDEYNFSDRDDRLKEIEFLSKLKTSSKFIISSRPAEFPYSIINSKKFEIAPFNDYQIESLVSIWLNDDIDLISNFMYQLVNSTYIDTVRRPLMLVHLLIIFKESSEKKIPKEAHHIYYKVVDMLIQRWDKERRIIRKSNYNYFNPERKKKLLCYISYYMGKENLYTFSRNEIRHACNTVFHWFELPIEDYEFILEEIESHNGLILRTRENRYEIAHRCIQEYFFALYILEKAENTNIHSLVEFSGVPNELAIYTAISKNPTETFMEIINDHYEENMAFNMNFLKRICLENPMFVVNEKLVVILIEMFNVFCEFVDVYNTKKFQERTAVFDDLFNLTNIKKSIKILENKYYISAYKVKGETNKGFYEKNKNQVYELKTIEERSRTNYHEYPIWKNNFNKRIFIKLKYLAEWSFFKTQ